MGTGHWRKGALKALAFAAVALGYVLWRHGGTLPASSRFWGLLALVIGPQIVAIVAADYLVRTGHEVVGKLVGFAGLAWLLGGSALLAAKTEALTLTDAERAPFVTTNDRGEQRLRHPTLGFSVLHPGPGFVVEGAQAFRRDAHFYSFVDATAAERLVIGLFKGQGESSASLRKLLETMGRQTDAVGGDAKLPARIVDVETSPGDPPRGVLKIALADGRHFQTAGYGWRAADGTSFAILVAVMARDREAGSEVLASFRP
jgi:hypothetical protein